jgi:transposase
MKGKIIMTQEGQKRVKVMEMLKEKQINQKEASIRLGVSVRQVKRIYRKYKDNGDEAMNHGLLGKQSNNRIEEVEKEKVMSLVREKFKGYKPSFITEKLLEIYSIKVKANTLRIWMMEEGLWQKVKKTAKHRTRRPRKEHFGEMIQMDGSPHDWFGKGEEFCLMHMVDDANNKAFGLFDTGETTEIALRSLYGWIEKYGIPQSIYTDHGSVFYVDREPTIEEQLKGIIPRTRFGQVCEDLGIEMIYANSPQAKGRVERANGIQQDRLISEMRFYGIKDMQSANQFLIEEYWERHNSKYSKEPMSEADFHIALIEGQNLKNLVCYSDDRKISQDYVVRMDNRFFQLLKKQNTEIKPRDTVIIKTWLDGSIHIFRRKVELMFKEIENQSRQQIA